MPVRHDDSKDFYVEINVKPCCLLPQCVYQSQACVYDFIIHLENTLLHLIPLLKNAKSIMLFLSLDTVEQE